MPIILYFSGDEPGEHVASSCVKTLDGNRISQWINLMNENIITYNALL